MSEKMGQVMVNALSSFFIMVGGYGLYAFASTQALSDIGKMIYLFAFLCLILNSVYVFGKGLIKWMK